MFLAVFLGHLAGLTVLGVAAACVYLFMRKRS